MFSGITGLISSLGSDFDVVYSSTCVLEVPILFEVGDDGVGKPCFGRLLDSISRYEGRKRWRDVWPAHGSKY